MTIGSSTSTSSSSTYHHHHHLNKQHQSLGHCHTKKIRLTVNDAPSQQDLAHHGLFALKFFALCVQRAKESDFDWTPKGGLRNACILGARKRLLLDRGLNPSSSSEAVPLDNNNDWCDACGGSGSFLCCEACPRSFHFACLEPPMDPCALPESAWFCAECQQQQQQQQSSMQNFLGSGKQLSKARLKESSLFWALSSSRNQNPVEFSLPPSIALPLWPRRIAISDALKGEGSLLLCHKCGLSALQAPLVRCTECPLAWHFDCLTPPLCSEPSQAEWICPIHPAYYFAEDEKVCRRKDKRKQAKPMRTITHHDDNDDDTEAEIRVALAFKSGKPHFGSALRFGQPVYQVFGCHTPKGQQQ
jgi:hypothetical protein